MTIHVVTGPLCTISQEYVSEHAAKGDLVVDLYRSTYAFTDDRPDDGWTLPADAKAVGHAARQAALDTILAGIDTPAWVIHGRPDEHAIEKYLSAGAEIVTVDPGQEAAHERAETDGMPTWVHDVIDKFYGDAEKTGKGDRVKHDRMGEGVAKTATATITNVKDDGLGSFEALVAVFGNVDSQGDMVTKGAFADALAAKATWPSVWAHQTHDDTAIIGTGVAKETDDGLVFTVDFLDTPRAQNIRKLMEAGVITEFSWSGRVTEGSWVDKDGVGPWGDGYYEIRKVDLWEAGPCFKGANPNTELLGVKSAVSHLATKEGRVLAQKHVTTLRTIQEELAEVIAAVEKPDDEEKSSTTEPPDENSGTESNPDVSEVLLISPTLMARLALA